MRAPRVALIASAVLFLEAAALVVFALIDMFGLGAGNQSSLPTAIALIVLTLIGAAALAAFGFGVRSGRSWARSGGVFVQVLAIALALASLTLQPVPWTFTIALALPGAVALVLLITSARLEAEKRSAD